MTGMIVCKFKSEYGKNRPRFSLKLYVMHIDIEYFLTVTMFLYDFDINKCISTC